MIADMLGLQYYYAIGAQTLAGTFPQRAICDPSRIYLNLEISDPDDLIQKITELSKH
jgi:hypothetical protein